MRLRLVNKQEPKKRYDIFVAGYMYEKAVKDHKKSVEQFELLEAAYKNLEKQRTETRNLLSKAQEIITRFENRNKQIYSCDCGRKNKSAVSMFFKAVVSLNNKYNRKESKNGMCYM